MSPDGARFGVWLRGKLVERHLSLAQLCREAGCDYTYLWRIIHSENARGRRYTRPSYTLTRKVGQVLDAPREALAAAGYGEGESLEAARAADRQARLDADVRAIREAPEAQRVPEPSRWAARSLPLLGHVQAGDLHEALENPNEYHALPEWLAAEADFALIVRGESMAPTLLEGDVVAVREQPTAEPGQLIVVLREDEATVKRFEIEAGLPIGAPDNKDYQEVRIGPRARIAGVVVGSFRPPEVLLRRPR